MQTDAKTTIMETFLDACGVHPALELEVESLAGARSVRYCLRQPFAVVGRHPAADIHLNSDGVRPRHLYFQAIQGRIACINVSQTGSFSTSQGEVSTFCWLPPDRTVQIASYTIKVLQEQREPERKPPELMDPTSSGTAWEIIGPSITVEISNDETPGKKKTWLVDRLVTLVGRTSRCAIRLNDECVSNVHCCLVLTPTGLWAVDVLGREGIVINEQPVRVGPLGMDDELRIGPFRIRLQETAEVLDEPDEYSCRTPTPMNDFELPTLLPSESVDQK